MSFGRRKSARETKTGRGTTENAKGSFDGKERRKHVDVIVLKVERDERKCKTLNLRYLIKLTYLSRLCLKPLEMKIDASTLFFVACPRLYRRKCLRCEGGMLMKGGERKQGADRKSGDLWKREYLSCT